MGVLREGVRMHQGVKGLCGLRKMNHIFIIGMGNLLWDNVGNVHSLLICLCSNYKFATVASVLNHNLQSAMKKIMCKLFSYRK